MGNVTDPSTRRFAALRTRWAAIGATLAVTLGGGGVSLVAATASSGERLTFVSIDPCRVIDIRPEFQVGPKTTPLGPNETLTVATHGSNGECNGIPNDAVALSLNVTALGATTGTFLAIWATGEPQPNASSLNPAPGQPPVPNAVTTRLSPTGQFNIYNKVGTVNVFVDINGYYRDHNHDDRYYTKSELYTRAEVDAQVDAEVAAAKAELTRAPDFVDVSPAEMRPQGEGTAWSQSFLWTRSKTPSSECLVFPVPNFAGRTVTGVTVVYDNNAGSDADLGVAVVGFPSVSGPATPASVHFLVQDTRVVSATPAATIDEVTATPQADNTLRVDAHYTGSICTDEGFSITAARVLYGDG